MPLPKPAAGESRDDFIGRCMADETMQTEYAEDDQRMAVCQSQWDEGKGKSDADEPPDEAGEAEDKAEPEQKQSQYTTKLEDIDRDKRTLVWRINTDAVDRDGEVILPSGADLKHFQDNPVVLWAHDYTQPPIAKALWTKASGDKHELISKPQFVAPGKYPGVAPDFASQVFELYADGYIRTASIGFRPLGSYRRPTEAEVKKRPDWAGAQAILDKWELLEYSAVPVPSNPDALQLAVKSMGMAKASAALLGIEEPEWRYGICECSYVGEWDGEPCPRCGKALLGSNEQPADAPEPLSFVRLGRFVRQGPERLQAPKVEPRGPAVDRLERPKPAARGVDVTRLPRPATPKLEPPTVQRVKTPTIVRPEIVIERVTTEDELREELEAKRRGIVQWVPRDRKR